jgi:hypothetical protein
VPWLSGTKPTIKIFLQTANGILKIILCLGLVF